VRIDATLNFVIPIYGDEIAKLDEDGKPVFGSDEKPVTYQPIKAYVHAIPLPAETVDRHFVILGQVFNQVWSSGLGAAAGPGMAMRLLKRIAQRTNEWDGPEGVEKHLIEEIRRCTMVIVKHDNEWRAVPLHVAVSRSIVMAEDQREVESAIVFFMCASATLFRADRRQHLEKVVGLWSAQLTSLNASAFAASLPKLNAIVNLETRYPAPVPQHIGAANATLDGKPSSVPH